MIVSCIYCLFHSEVFWVSIGSIGTVIAAVIALSQLNKLNQTTSADFIHRYKNDFYTESNSEILMLLEYDALELSCEELPNKKLHAYFFIKNELREKLKDLVKNPERKYTEFEMDDFLGDLEDLGMLYQKKILSFDFIYEWFSSCIIIAMKNEQIEKYIKYVREDVKGAYTNLEVIYSACKARETNQK